MNKKIILWILIPLILLALFIFGIMPHWNAALQEDPAVTETQPPVRQGLVKENGALYYYNNDGTPFTGGFKKLTVDGTVNTYFFQEDGTAFTDGHKEVMVDGVSCHYFFQEDGCAITDNWQTVNGTTWYFDSNGQAVADTFLTIDGNLYYFDETCAVVTGGWFCLEDGYYYADENGIIATDTVVEGYKLDATGKSVTKYRIVRHVQEHTDDSMTTQEKIDALYNWVLTNDMTYIRSYEHVKADWVWQDGWVDDMATSQMDEWGGNCYRYAAFLGMLLREATGLPVTVYRGQTPGLYVDLTDHGWAAVYQEDTWYIYDVELDKFTEYDSSGCYKVPASESTLHLQGVGTDLYS